MKTHVIKFDTGQYLSKIINEAMFDTCDKIEDALKIKELPRELSRIFFSLEGYKCEIVEVKAK